MRSIHPWARRASTNKVPYLLLCMAFAVSLASPLPAAEPASRYLDSGWQFRALGKAGRGDLSTWHPGQVPGVVQTDLLRDGLIPQPFYRDNESRLQWIGLTDWEYRDTFQADTSTLVHENVDLVFEGLDTFADVYLNDRLLIQTNNCFRAWRISARKLLQPGANTLRIVFHSPVEKILPYVRAQPYVLPAISTINGGNEGGLPTAPYTRKPPYQYGWDWGPRFVTQGIWRPVRLETWDVLRIDTFHIVQRKITPEAAVLDLELDVEASHAAPATISLEHDPMSAAQTDDGSRSVQLDPGINHLSVPVRISAPRLWYPAGYGKQNRYHFSAVVRLGQETAARAERITGLRSVELRRVPDPWGKSFTFVINGIAVFAKGANVIPFDSFPPRVTAERHRAILQAALDAHMNMVREWGGGYYESDDFYDICDELGLLVWQEFSFGGDMVPGDTAFQENVRQEAIEQIKRLRDHPSIVLWCGNNEIETGWLHWADRQAFKATVSPDIRERVWQDYMVLFADILKSAVTRYAAPVPYWPSSPSADFEEPPDNDHNGDMHYWMVWHGLAPAVDYLKQFPRFMTEFGFQSFPDMRTIRAFTQPADLDIRSVVMQSHQKNKGGNERILTYMLREYHEPRDFASFVYLSQVQQAEIIKLGAEHFRRQRPRTMGALYWQLNDCWPVASWSSIDYYGRWKALHYFARRFFADILVSPYAHDDKVDVYVVSDRLQSISGTIRVRLLDFSGKTFLDEPHPVDIPAQSSAIYLSLDQKTLAAKATPRRSFLVVDLEMGGKRLSRNLVFFDHMRNLALPVVPRIDVKLYKKGEAYSLTLRTPGLARNVYVSFADLDVAVSDNYFDLLPGEPVTVDLTTSSSLQQLESALKIMSLTEAFTPSAEP
jgi:beta-mannosidase